MRIAVLGLLVGMPLVACTCRLQNACWVVRQPVVFVGELVGGGVTSLKDNPWHSRAKHARFRVLESFVGVPPGTTTVDVKLNLWDGMCSPIPYDSRGGKYLVVPHEGNDGLEDGFCFQGRDLRYSLDELRYVRDYFSGKVKPNIHGTVSVGGKPGAGAHVFATYAWSVFEAIADETGRYTLPLPTLKPYDLRVELPPFATARKARIYPDPADCSAYDFFLQAQSTVSGRVWDQSGNVVKDAAVGLIDIDEEAAGRTSLINRDFTQKDGTFTIKNVAPGNYLLAFNPEGPHRSTLPFATTYYPVATTRKKGKVVEVRSNDTHLRSMDLVVGTRVQFRNATVAVKFRDGTSMSTGVVRCTGDRDWLDYGHVGKSGEVTLLVPADQRIKIDVTDWYGRDLKTTYSATFEPGTTAITKEFIITP